MIGQKPDGMIRIKISSRESRDDPLPPPSVALNTYLEPKTQLIKTHTVKSVKKIGNFKKQERNSKFKVSHNWPAGTVPGTTSTKPHQCAKKLLIQFRI